MSSAPAQQVTQSTGRVVGTSGTGSGIVGEVQGLRPSTEQHLVFTPWNNYMPFQQETRNVWSFTVVQHDALGNLIQQVPVQIQGRAIEGLLRDSDMVELADTWRGGGGVLRVKQLYNVTLQQWVIAKNSSAGRNFCLVVTIIMMLVVLGIMLYFFLTDFLPMWRSFPH